VVAPHASGSLVRTAAQRLPVTLGKAAAVVGASAALFWGGSRLWMSPRHAVSVVNVREVAPVTSPEPVLPLPQRRAAEPVPAPTAEPPVATPSTVMGSTPSRRARHVRAAPSQRPVPASDRSEEAPVAVDTPPVQAPQVIAAVEEAQKPQSASEVTEAQILSEARKVLASDPGRALAGVQRHQQLFPSGALVQEREILAIEALRRLGREAEANARAQSFRTRFPSSIHGRTFALPRSSQR